MIEISVVGRTVMEPAKPKCGCLDVVSAQIDEICRRSDPVEVMSERDFYQLQVLLQIQAKIEARLGLK